MSDASSAICLPRITPPPPPAGTGKTEVIACLVKHVLAAAGGSGRLLLCAPSNLAVDELTRRLVAGRRHFKDGTWQLQTWNVRLADSNEVRADGVGFSRRPVFDSSLTRFDLA